jgi:glycine/D-amino acid oxidase-like deaminating enzyme
MGSVTELLDDLTQMTETEVFSLFEARKKGLERLRHRLGDATIRYAEEGSYELISDQEIDALDKIAYLNNLLLPLTLNPAFELASEKIDAFGFSNSYTKALIRNTAEGSLHTGKMLRALTDHALRAGIEIKTGADVKSFHESSKGIVLTLKDHSRKGDLELHTQVMLLCTNAFTKDLMPDEDVVPGRGQVLITKPIEGLKFKGIYHFDKGYYYFREIDGRILLGGGRNTDFHTETTTVLELNLTIQSTLEAKLRDIIIPGTTFEVAQRWSGIMAFGSTKHPIVKSFSPRTFGAFRMGGMGVALGSEVAMKLADMVADNM